MNFEYQITKHPASEIRQVIYFCTDKGECSYDQLPESQLSKLVEILNRHGAAGWELVQLSFGQDGVIAFWKKGK